MKEKILNLRQQGKSYKQIVKELGCSIGTVSYHCGEGQKAKVLNRSRDQRKNNVIQVKINRFKYEKPGNGFPETRTSDRNIIAERCRDFQRRIVDENDNVKMSSKAPKGFNHKDVLSLFGNEPKCYLTGRKIDLTLPCSYQFDHIVPVAKGGPNTIENLGLTCKEANVAKSNMTVNEFVSLCKEVLEHNGYKVEKYGE